MSALSVVFRVLVHAASHPAIRAAGREALRAGYQELLRHVYARSRSGI